MDRLAFLIATGLARGAIFALFALSLVLIWRAARIVNFAQGAMALVATYIAFAVTGLTGSYWAGLAAGIVAGAAVGFGVERGVMRFAPHSSPLSGVIVAIGLVMVLQSLLGILFGQQYRPMSAPFDDSPIVVGGVPLLSPYDLFVLVVATVVMAGLALLFTRTSLGLQLRASAFAPEVSRVLGVRVSPHGDDRMDAVGRRRGPRGDAARPHRAGPQPPLDGCAVRLRVRRRRRRRPRLAGRGAARRPVVGVAMTLVTGYLGATVAPIGVLVLLRGGAAGQARRDLLDARGAQRMSRFLPSLTGMPRTVVFGAALTVLAIGATFLLDPYRNFQLATIAAYFCAVAGLTVLVGLSGQLSLGQAALMAAGGYGYALTANAADGCRNRRRPAVPPRPARRGRRLRGCSVCCSASPPHDCAVRTSPASRSRS